MRNRFVTDSERKTQVSVGPCRKGRRWGFSIAPIAAILLSSMLCRSVESNGQATLALSNAALSANVNVTNSEHISFTLANSFSPGSEAVAATNEVVRGIIQLPNGTTYEGETAGGVPHGEGTLTDQNGTRQSGQWRYGEAYKISGKIVFPDGTTEVGNWNNNGSKSGGTITWKNGQVYKGDWKIGEGATPEVPDGAGEMNWPDGRRYVGQFRDGQMDGAGKMTYPGGKTDDGSWKKARFLGPTQ